MKEKASIEREISDTLIESWQGFSIGGRHFNLYPVTLGKSILLQRVIAQIGIDEENLSINAELEMLRIADEKKFECCRYIAYHTLRTKEEVFDTALVDDVTGFLVQNADTESIATLLTSLLTSDKTNKIVTSLALDKEHERYSRALKAKKSKDGANISFCGKSIYGRLIDFVCERYGWTIHHSVWEVSFANLQLLVADSAKTLYLTKDEMRKAHISADDITIKGDDKASMEMIKQMNWD